MNLVQTLLGALTLAAVIAVVAIGWKVGSKAGTRIA